MFSFQGTNGQACFWFSNGCDIGSGSCDGNSGQVIPCCTPKFKLTGNGSVPPDPWGAEGIEVDEDFVKSFDRNKLRPKNLKFPDRKATICDPRLRTLNTQAECGSPADFWYNAPWRYPGITPVIDSCGAAGGRLPGQGPAPGGGAGATYVNTTNAKLSDVGSRLPPLMSGTVW